MNASDVQVSTRRRLATALLAAAAAFILAGSTAANAATLADRWGPARDGRLRAQEPGMSRTAITGQVRLFGCEAAPWEIRLRAAPVTAFRTGRSGLPTIPSDREIEASAPVARARLERTSNPRILNFTLPAVQAGTVYRLGIQAASETCGHMVFRGPEQGLATAGDSRPVIIRGYALRSKLEVMGGTDGGRQARWVGADNLDFLDPAAAVRGFRWYTDLDGVSAGELQISTERFSGTGMTPEECENPRGIVYRREVAAEPGGWSEIPGVDLGRILNPGRSGGTALPGEELHPPDARTRELLLRGAPVFARVVPLEASPFDGTLRHRCDSASDGLPGWVVLAMIAANLLQPPSPDQPPVEVSSQHFSEYFPPIPVVLSGDIKACYVVTKPHTLPSSIITTDSMGLMLALAGGSGLGQEVQPGDTFCTYQKSGGSNFWSSLTGGFEDFITGVVDAFGAVVNGLANLYADIKAKAITWVADALDKFPGLNCGPNTLCRDAAGYAVESGMVAMGLPPSLPDFDQLMDEGIDYLAAELAEEANVPPVVADLASGVAKQIVKEVAKSGKAGQGLPGADWVIVDEMFRPATMTLEISRTSPFLPVPDFLFRMKSDLFMGTLVPLPDNLPVAPDALKIPMVLFPNYEGITPPPTWVINGEKYPYPEPEATRWMLRHWRDDKYNLTPCLHHEAFALALGSPALLYPEILNVDLPTKGAWLFDDPNWSACTP